ncbi:MAG: methyltransferase [Gemmatimonadetes bacterium]|nr:methyltransferase [Gemmatimonadota bacterium]NIR79433.1 methyltransferase [Gemmatimonadota bacterium]NIT88114.1 methyltransferase [Gemmatimonadota bacterium]NIU31941.1 methyltransferase [Gemmatimonadota bacterium]NIU36551.1 methyltransferase [Gemmatimonadota bacterium]
MSSVPDRWLVVSVRAPGSTERHLLLDALVRLGARAVEERDGALVTHFPPPPDAETFVDEIRWRLSTVHGVGPSLEVSWSWQPHEDWAELWRRELVPRRVSPRIVVTPTWLEPDAEPGDVVIRLDPGVAFGTAEHATTRGCLRLLEGAVSTGDRVADLGTGSGILAIAACLLGAREVRAVDADPFACAAARENAASNGCADRLHVTEARLGPGDVADLGPLDGITANIDAGVVVELLSGAARAIGPDGWLVVGGILAAERDEVVDEAGKPGLRLDAEDREEKWWSGLFRGSC